MKKRRNKPRNLPVTHLSLLTELRAAHPRKPDQSPSEWAKEINKLLAQQERKYHLKPLFRKRILPDD